MFKRAATLLAIVSIVSLIVSCGNDGSHREEPEKNANGSSATVTYDDPLVPVIEEHVAGLAEENDFSGMTFTWIGSGYQAPAKNEEIGDIQSDALYYRQRDIEEQFSLSWVNYVPEALEDLGMDPFAEAVKQDVLAGTGAYDAGYGMVFTCQALLANDVLTDTSDFTAVDLDNPWWTQSLRDTYNINGALYFLNGPILSCHYQDCYSVLFNKQIAEDYGIEDLYSLVKSGEWTFDKMFEVASVIPTNENGSGVYRYGDPDAMSTIIACGMTVTKFDENGIPYIEEQLSLELSNLADKFCRIYGDDTQTANCKGWASGGHENIEEKYGYDTYEEMFDGDEIFFLFIPTDEAAWIRLMDVEFGILPMPKASTEQEDYVSYATPDSTFHVFVPKSSRNIEDTDVILEAMAALGYKYFKPVFYENILKGRMTFDHDSKEMIDIIFRTKKYDLIDMLDVGGSINGPGTMVRLFSACIQESSDGFASRYFLQSKIVNSNIKVLLANVEANRR